MCCLPTHLRGALVASLAIAALALSAPAQAAPGDLDPSFGTGGIVLSNLNAGKGSQILDVQAETDGRIVALERTTGDTRHLLRYLPDGTLDPSFSGDGIAALPSDIWANAIALQKDGKIVVSGSDPSYRFVVARYLPSGAIDQDFDGDTGTANGVIRTKLTAGVDMPMSLAVDDQGRIVQAGDAGSAPATSDAGVVRLLPDGRLDKSFAGDGTLVYDTAVEVRIQDVAVQADGKVIVAGGWGSAPTTDTMIQRFTESGTPDAFGGGSGRRIVNLGGEDFAGRVVVQAGGQLVVGAASATGDMNKLIRLTPNGSVDAGFGSDSHVALTIHLGALGLAPDGKIVVAGGDEVDGLLTFAVERLSADGVSDVTFAHGSPAVYRPVNGERSFAGAVAVAPDGKIIATGTTGEYPGTRGALMRLQGQPDAEPTPDPAPVTTAPATEVLTLSGVNLTNRVFAVGRARTARVGQAQAASRRRRGTAFVFRLNHGATVSIRIKRRGKKVAALKRTARAGGNRVRFSGRVGRRALRPGRYRATLTAIDTAGKRSKPATVAFRVVRG